MLRKLRTDLAGLARTSQHSQSLDVQLHLAILKADVLVRVCNPIAKNAKDFDRVEHSLIYDARRQCILRTRPGA